MYSIPARRVPFAEISVPPPLHSGPGESHRSPHTKYAYIEEMWRLAEDESCTVDKSKSKDRHIPTSLLETSAKSASILVSASTCGHFLSWVELRRSESIPHVHFHLAELSREILACGKKTRLVLYDDACHLAKYTRGEIGRTTYSRYMAQIPYIIGNRRRGNHKCVKY